MSVQSTCPAETRQINTSTPVIPIALNPAVDEDLQGHLPAHQVPTSTTAKTGSSSFTINSTSKADLWTPMRIQH